LLNNDTVVDGEWIVNLVKAARGDPQVGAVACKVLSAENPSILDCVGLTGIAFWRGYRGIGHLAEDVGQYDDSPIEPFGFSGAAALLLRKGFLDADGFDEMISFYAEDADLSWRMRLVGYRILYSPAARVFHAGSRNFPISAIRNLNKRHVLRVIIKNCDSNTLLTALVSYLIWVVGRGVRRLIQGSPDETVEAIHSMMWNFIHLQSALRLRSIIQSRTRQSAVDEVMFRYSPCDRWADLQKRMLRMRIR
jgi:hypothetical protein